MATAPKSVEINGRTVTDPKQVDRIERNREASARYAADAYRSEGTPVPTHLIPYVEAQATQKASTPSKGILGGYTGLRDMVNGGGPGAAGPTFVGGPLANTLNRVGLRPFGGATAVAPAAAKAPAAPAQPGIFQQGFSRLTGGYTGIRDMFDGGGPGASANRLPPTPGPNYIAALGRPGTPREDRQPTPEATQDATTTDSVDSGNDMTGEQVSAANAAASMVPTYEAGGMVGPDGVPMRPSTASLDLPPALARLLAMPMQSYAEGGMVGPGGVPQRPMASPMAMNLAQQGGAPVVGIAQPGQTGRPLNFAAIDQQAQQFMQQQPQQVEQIRAEVQKAMASGEVDAQSLNMFVQIATTALQNPEMWPQLRQVLIRQGMLDAEDVSEEYDQGFLIVLYIIGKTMGTGGAATPPAAPQGGAPMSAGQAPEMSMATGGALPTKSKNPDGSIPINAHEGEYVIPADVTRRLGTDHFDKLIAKARGADNKGEQ